MFLCFPFFFLLMIVKTSNDDDDDQSAEGEMGCASTVPGIEVCVMLSASNVYTIMTVLPRSPLLHRRQLRVWMDKWCTVHIGLCHSPSLQIILRSSSSSRMHTTTTTTTCRIFLLLVLLFFLLLLFAVYIISSHHKQRWPL